MVNRYIDGTLVNKGVVIQGANYTHGIRFTQPYHTSLILYYNEALPRSWELVLKEGRERNLQTMKFTFPASSKSRQSDEGLTLERSAFLTFHGGNSTFINSFDKTKFLL